MPDLQDIHIANWIPNETNYHPYTTPLGGNKMSTRILTHTYLYKALRKIKVTICNMQSLG